MYKPYPRAERILKVGDRVMVRFQTKGRPGEPEEYESEILSVNLTAGQYQPYYHVRGCTSPVYHPSVRPLE